MMIARPDGDVHVWVCQGPKLESEDLIARALAHYREWDAEAHRLHRSANGKIHVLDRTGASPFYVNVSRAGDMAICAVACDGPIGADIESLDRADWVAAHRDLLPSCGGTGRAMLEDWVRLEAAHKAAGVGLLEEQSLAATDPANGEWQLHQVNGALWKSICAPLAGTHLIGVALAAHGPSARLRKFCF